MNKTEKWTDTPDKRGDYWISPFIDGHYIEPHIITVIDYARPDRGIEVKYTYLGDTVPVDVFVREYYPKTKWLFIEVPDWKALND